MDKARAKLRDNEAYEIASQRTLFGPHRDDLLILVNDLKQNRSPHMVSSALRLISLKDGGDKIYGAGVWERPVVF